MTRPPQRSRRASAAGPSKPRKTRVPNQQIAPGPSNVDNFLTQRRSSRLSGNAPSDSGLEPQMAVTRLDKGKKRMRDDDELAVNMGPVAPSESSVDVVEAPQPIGKSRGPMLVDDMVEDIRALRVSEPPTMRARGPLNLGNALQLAPSAHIGSKPATPLRREARIGDPNANANVAPLIEIRKKEMAKAKEPKPQPQHPPFDFKPLLRDPPLLVPQETSNPGYFDWEKRQEAERIRDAVATYRVRNLEGIIPLKNWDADDIAAWALNTPFVTGKLFQPVHIPRPELGPLCTTELSDLSLVYHWVRRIATLACKAVSMTIQTSLVPDLRTRWEVMNTKGPDPYFGYMCFMPFNGYTQRNPATVVIGVQTPFGLNPGDFSEIVRGGSFPYTSNVPLQGKYHSWANLYDACKQRGTRWFALTSYCQWVFGVFSVDYATALVSPVYAYNTRAPNIVELLAYWFASARNGHGTFVPPKIDVAIGYKLKEVQNERFGMTQKRWPGKPPTRQDYWDGRDSDCGTKTSILTRTDGTVASLYPDSEQSAFIAAKVNSWNSPFPKVPLDNKLWETAQAGFTPPPMQGEWMVPIQ